MLAAPTSPYVGMDGRSRRLRLAQLVALHPDLRVLGHAAVDQSCLRANMKWAPFPDNDPDAARALMRRFYEMLAASEGAGFDPVRAAALEVEWWRAHREKQHHAGDGSASELVVALRDLYAHTYGVEPADVELAAELRAEAMDVSDRWVENGCDPEAPALAEERALLVRSYAALLAAVHR